MADATKDLDGSDESSQVISNFNDIVTSIQDFRQHVDTIMDRIAVQQEEGVQQLRLSRSSVQEQVQQCMQVLQSWQQHLCMEVTGLTTVAISDLRAQHDELQHCRAVLDSALTKVEGVGQCTLPPSELIDLSLSLKSSVDEAASTVLRLDQLTPPQWPEVSLNQGPDCFPEVLAKMSSRALGHVSDAVHIKDALQPLTRTGVSRVQSSVCKQGDWITMAMEMSGSSSVPCCRILPFLSYVVRVDGLASPCDVHCAVKDTSISLWLQAPPCLGFGELSVSVNCFLKPVPGSPLLLTLQGGSCSSSTPPTLTGLASPVLLLPRTDALDAQNRSVLCGCVCGGLCPTLASPGSPGPCTPSCTGDCMVQIIQQEKSPSSCSVVSVDLLTAKSGAGARVGMAANPVINGNIVASGLTTPTLPSKVSVVPGSNKVSPSLKMENLSLLSPPMDISQGVLTLDISSRERRSLDLLCDDSKLAYPECVSSGQSSQNLAKRMREGSLSTDSLCAAPPFSFSSTLPHRSTSSMGQQLQPTALSVDQFADTLPTSTFSFECGSTSTTSFCNGSFPRSLSVGSARRGGGVSRDGRSTSVRRMSRPPGPQSRFGPAITCASGRQLHYGSGGVTNGLEVVQGGDFIPLDSNQPLVQYGDPMSSGSAFDLIDHPGNCIRLQDTNADQYDSSLHDPHLKVYSSSVMEDGSGREELNLHLNDEAPDVGEQCVLGSKTEASSAADVPLEAAMEASDEEQYSLRGDCVQVYGGPSSMSGPGAQSSGNQALKSPIGVLQLPDGTVVVCDTFNNRLVQFSEDGPLRRVFNSSPPLNKPSAVVLLPTGLVDSSPSDGDATLEDRTDGGSGKAVFAVKDHVAIYIFDGGCKQLRVLARRQLSRPYGLTVDDEGLLVTVETGVGAGALPTITRLHPETGAITRVPFNLVPDTAKGGVSKPRFISYHRDEVLIVVDLGLDVVAMVSMTDGAVLRRFGRSGTGPGQFRDPSGVVCDADGYMILGDSRNHRIQVFSATGDFLFVLRVDRPLRRPSGLCLTPCGHLLVINYWENTVVKFKLSI